MCEPQESSYPSRRWSLSIDQRRRQALRGGNDGGWTQSLRVRGAGRAEGPAPAPPPPRPRPAPAPPVCPLPTPPWPAAIPDPALPAGPLADRGPAGVRGRGQGRAPPPSAEDRRVHQGLPSRLGPECAFPAQRDFGGPGLEVSALLRAHSAQCLSASAFPVGSGETACQVWAARPLCPITAHLTVTTSQGGGHRPGGRLAAPPQSSHPRGLGGPPVGVMCSAQPSRGCPERPGGQCSGTFRGGPLGCQGPLPWG